MSTDLGVNHSNNRNNMFTKRCESCKSTKIETEDQGLLVCTDCGKIYRDIDQLRNDPKQELTINCHQYYKRFYLSSNIRNNLPINRLTVTKRMGLETVKTLSSRFNLTRDMKTDALNIWDVSCNHVCFNCSSKQTKQILAAVCVYATLLRENKPIAIGHICNHINCSINEFGKVYTLFIREFPQFKSDSIPIEQLVAVTLSEAVFDDKERIKIQNRVNDLIILQRECCLIEGRSPVHIIFGAAYLAWKSLQPSQRNKVKLTEFCHEVCIEYKHTTSERVTELFNALKTLAAKIPSKQNVKITKQNIAVYIDEILSYRNSLIYDLKRPMICKTDKTNDQSENTSFDWMNTFKRKIPAKPIMDNKSENNSGKTGDEEFSDTELDAYIRKPEEVKIIKKLKSLVQSEDETNN